MKNLVLTTVLIYQHGVKHALQLHEGGLVTDDLTSRELAIGKGITNHSIMYQLF